ncbi:MAG TPA: hypothetical protein VN685_06260 [Rhizomicrobium sp.]|nr:hypothetical protein [Rhizomicrobium sp.]
MAKEFRAGEWVEIRPLSEVLKTLGPDGTLDGLPFMPEMARYCGQRFKVVASAHKTCDPTGATDMRRMKDAVHLETRCDGGAHGGCEARCRFYWKTAWLAPVKGPVTSPVPVPSEAEAAPLHAFTHYQTEAGLRYRCQSTEIVRATLPTRNLGQYAKDLRTGNVTLGYALHHVIGQFGKAAWSRVMRLSRRHTSPCAVAAMAGRQAQARLNLVPGEFVRVRSAKEIAATLDEKRGPALEPEMLRHCGNSHRVLYRVNRVIDERTGKMLKLRNDCVVLDDIACGGLDNKARLFCPRACYYFWREAWLERAEDAAPAKINGGSIGNSQETSELASPELVLARRV